MMDSRDVLSGFRKYTLKSQRYDFKDTFPVIEVWIAGYLTKLNNFLYVQTTPIFT